MKKNVALIFFTIIFCSTAIGQKHNINVQGRVADIITGSPLSAKIFLMDADSTVIDTTTAVTEEFPFQGMLSMYVFNKSINQKGRYIIKAVMQDYKDAFTDIQLQSYRQSCLVAKPILMEHDYHELPEVLVKATKIKMVMRGDTIVYNADAFNLAEGSMLDALISRLPGAQLTKDGQIYVNGKRIQSMLLNGRDFFSGNPKLALENLPAYTINRIKVYEKEGDNSHLMQKNMGDQSFVMDVGLKKEYNTTVFGYIEGGIGTEERFALKGLSMKTSQKEMLLAFTNINNLNDNQKADMNGQWTSQDAINDIQTKRTANVSYARFFDSMMDKWLSTQNTFSRDNIDCQSIEQSEIYLPNGSLNKSVRSSKNTMKTQVESKNALHYAEDGKYSTMSNLNLLYMRNENNSHVYTTNSDATTLLNELREDNTAKNENYNLTFSHNSMFRHITDALRLYIDTEFDKRNESSFALYNLKYADKYQTHDFRNNYFEWDSHHWNVKGGMSYDWNWPGWSVRTQYQYNFKYNSTNNAIYRLDKLEDIDSTRYDILPSAKSSLLSVLDTGNSYYFTEYQRHHRMMFEWCIDGASKANKLNIDYGYIRLPLRVVSKNMYYTRVGRHDVYERATFFEPEIYIRGNKAVAWVLDVGVKSEIPDLVKKVDYSDDVDPLHIVSGNPELKNIHRYNISLSLRHKSERQRMWSTAIKYCKTDNDIAYATLYDKNTGSAAMMPVSVNGNWHMKGQFEFSMPLDSMRLWILDNHFTLCYNHSVDMTTVAGSLDSMRSIVENWQWNGGIRINFRPNEIYEFALSASGTYYQIHSQRNDFTNINAGEIKLGFETELRMPYDLAFSTDFSMHARRGYQQSMMNITEWIWNAHLHRTFLRGALLAKLTCFDLLHQLSNTKYEMNEQGRAEIWQNSLPRYVMMSLAWKFNIKPKIRKS